METTLQEYADLELTYSAQFGIEIKEVDFSEFERRKAPRVNKPNNSLSAIPDSADPR